MKDDPPARIDEPKLGAAVRRWLLRYIRRAREAKKEAPLGDADRPTFIRGLQLAVRSAVSATLAFSIAQASKLDHPIFALAAAVIATDLTPARSRELGFRRLVATAIGGLSGAVAASLGFVGIWAVGPSILIAMRPRSAFCWRGA